MNTQGPHFYDVVLSLRWVLYHTTPGSGVRPARSINVELYIRLFYDTANLFSTPIPLIPMHGHGITK